MKPKILTVILSSVLVIFVIYQIFASLYNPISTEIVTQTETVDGISITGIIIREEILVKNPYSGTLHFEIEDSERVSKNGVIANVFNTPEQSYAASEIVSVTNEINNIEEIQSYNDMNAADLDLINSKLYASLNKIICSSQCGDYYGLSEYKESLLTLINRKQMVTGEVLDFSSQLSELKNKLAALKTQLGTPIGTVNAEKAGYFLSVTDGYEGVLTTDNLSGITPEFLEGLTPVKSTDSSVIGKLVSDYTWYIAASVSINESLQFKNGDTLTVLTGLQNFPEISVTVDRVNMSVSDDKAVVIFSCNQMNSELSTIRTTPMTVVKNTYSGLKVSSKALRFQNEQNTLPDASVQNSPVTGVYVVTGMTAKFVPVNIVYSTTGYVICELSNEDNNLKLYDEIIVKGKNIYDGKTID